MYPFLNILCTSSGHVVPINEAMIAPVDIPKMILGSILHRSNALINPK